MSSCSVSGCEGAVDSWGLCNKHYLRLRKHGSVDENLSTHAPMEERFWRRVAKRTEQECWEWVGTKRNTGYGVIHSGGRGGKYVSTHRYSCGLHHGPPPTPTHVAMHSCDNRSCVNPHHLRWGTASENIKEAFTKNRKQPTILRGLENPRSKLNEDQVRFVRANAGLGPAKLGRICGCAPTTIHAVLSGRTWKHL